MSDAFSAPTTDGTHDDLEQEVPRISPLVYVGAIALIGMGITEFAVAMQAVAFIYFSTWWLVLAYSLAPLGVLAMVFGGLLIGARDWAAFGGVAIALLNGFFALAWNVFSMANGMFSILTMIGLLMAGLAVICAPLAVPNAMAVSRARRALYAA